MCEVGTKGAELAHVHPAETDIVLEKFSYDCFAGTDLLQNCKGWGIDTIVITGVRAEICVTHTTCRSFAEGFRTVVVRDPIGTYDDRREMAAVVLDALGYSSIIMNSSDIERVLAA